MLPHRSLEFQEIFQRVVEKLRRTFFPGCEVFLLPAGEFGMQEAAVRNFIQERLLVCTTGYASERWVEIARANDRQADVLTAECGDAIDPGRLADFLAAQHYDAVAFAHTEVSTSVANPVGELASVVHRASPDTLVLLDAAAALGGVELPLEEWGIDFTLASSEMCLALPPGLGLCAASPRAIERAAGIHNRGWYFDFIQMQRRLARDIVPTMPAIPLIYALDVQLDRIYLETMAERAARHQALAERVWAWAEQRDLPFLANRSCRAIPLTVIQNRRGLPIDELNRFLMARGMRLANGLGPFKDTFFCIATMGETLPAELEALLSAIDAFTGG